MLKGLFIMGTGNAEKVYPGKINTEIERLVDIKAPPMTPEEVLKNPSILADVELIFSGWGGPKLDDAFLKATPQLKVMFYGAGTIKHIMTDDAWSRNIMITTAADANAVPVAEYSLSQILFLLKNGWQITRYVRENKAYPDRSDFYMAGGYDRTIGIISLSSIGKKVIKLLEPFDLNVLLYDPFVTEEQAQEWNVELCSLDEIFEKSDVVSLHSPLLEKTTSMIKGEHFRKMKPNASFLNTARGAIVDEPAMIDVLAERQDITAVLDVTYPEPPPSDSLLYRLPNVVVTPHIAGSLQHECARMGEYMLDELKRYLNDQPLKWQVTKEQFDLMA